MKIRYIFAVSVAVCLLFGARLFAQDSITAPRVQWTGLAALEEGQFVKCHYYQEPGNGDMPFQPWVGDFFARLGVRASAGHFSLAVIPQIELWDDTFDWQYLKSTDAPHNPLNQHVSVTLADAEGVYHLGSRDAIALNIAAGVIPYKYDEEARNLGEYLFRTGEHPAYIETSFDVAYATLTGVRVNAEILRNLSLDLFFTSETQVQPMNDWSLSFLAGYTLPGFLDVGAGVMLDRLISAEGKIATLGSLDQLAIASNEYLTSTGQKDTFSWGGTKIMARCAFDPKGFFPKEISSLFGKEDGKLYGEAAILGVKSITAYTNPQDSNGNLIKNEFVVDSSKNFYSNIKQRIPVMFGFNMPTFTLLDYLSAELEWYGWPYSSDLYYYQDFKFILPEPNGASTSSHWKYSFNFRKTLLGNVMVIGQVARDHTRHDVYYNGTNTDVTEVFQPRENWGLFGPNDEWGWWLKLQVMF
jgi:hypothetical protein